MTVKADASMFFMSARHNSCSKKSKFFLFTSYMISRHMSHSRIRSRFFFGAPMALLLFLLSICPAANSQSRALSEGIEYLMKMAARSRPNVRPAFEIVAKGVAVVNTANGAYKIYIDCRTGMASQSLFYLPQNQQLSLVGQMCSNF